MYFWPSRVEWLQFPQWPLTVLLATCGPWAVTCSMGVMGACQFFFSLFIFFTAVPHQTLRRVCACGSHLVCFSLIKRIQEDSRFSLWHARSSASHALKHTHAEKCVNVSSGNGNAAHTLAVGFSFLFFLIR